MDWQLIERNGEVMGSEIDLPNGRLETYYAAAEDAWHWTRTNAVGVTSLDYDVVGEDSGYGTREAAESACFDYHQIGWQGTVKEAQDLLYRAERIADAAWEVFSHQVDTGPAQKVEIGEWCCEVTSLIRNERAIWRVGKLIAREGDNYEIETLHGKSIIWQNAKMIRAELIP